MPWNQEILCLTRISWNVTIGFLPLAQQTEMIGVSHPKIYTIYITWICLLKVMFYGFDPMGLFTIFHHHLGEYVLCVLHVLLFQPPNKQVQDNLIWQVLSDEQMSKEWSFSLLNDEQMSNWLGVEHCPVINFNPSKESVGRWPKSSPKKNQVPHHSSAISATNTWQCGSLKRRFSHLKIDPWTRRGW